MGDRNTVTGTQNTHSTHKNTDLMVYSGMSRIESVFARLRACVSVQCRRTRQTKKLMHNLDSVRLSMALL